MLQLIGYDDDHVLGEIVITALTLEGGTELADLEEPPFWDDGLATSNRVFVHHDRQTVGYTATAEVTCVAPGEVRSASRPNQIFGLEWEYQDGDSGGCLNRYQEPDGCAFAFTCTE